MTTKQQGKYVRAMAHLSRAEWLDVAQLAEKRRLTVSRLLRSIVVPIVRAQLEREP